MNEASSSGRCSPGSHIYVYAGQSPMPDGWPCACGLTWKRPCNHCHGTGIETSLLSNEPLTAGQMALGQSITKKYGLDEKP